MLNSSGILPPVLKGMDGSLHPSLPSMNRLNPTEPEDFQFCRLWHFGSPISLTFWYQAILIILFLI